MNQPVTELEQPPCNQDAERSMLGAVMVDPSSLDRIRMIVEPSDLYVERHRYIYRAMLSLYQNDQPIDLVTLGDEIGDDLDKVGGPQYLTRLSNETPSAQRARKYAEIVEEKSKYRDSLSELRDLTREAQDASRPHDEFANEATERVLGLATDSDDDRLADAQELSKEAYAQIEEWCEQTEPNGLTTGYEDLDERLGWLRPSTLNLIGGRPGMGKSALAHNMQSRQSRQGIPTILFSLEMASEAITIRQLALESKVNSEHMREGIVDGDGWDSLLEVTSDYQNRPIYIDDTPRIEMAEMEAKARLKDREVAADDEIDADGLGVIYIDYLQLAQLSHRAETNELRISEIGSRLKALAKDLEVPVVALAQLNRGVENRENKRPRLSDLRYSGALEQHADTVSFVYRDAYYDDDSDRAGVAEILIRKNREGDVGTVELAWTPEYTRFDDYDPRY